MLLAHIRHECEIVAAINKRECRLHSIAAQMVREVTRSLSQPLTSFLSWIK